jgi:uncharacterized membrane protein
MSNLVAITYPDEHRAGEVLATLKRLHADNLIDLADACYVTKDKRGHLKLHQGYSLTGEGAKEGTQWGAIIGLLLSMPLMFVPGLGIPVLIATGGGAAIGAATGAIVGHFSDIGVDDKFAKQLAEQLGPNSSAVLALVKAAKVEEVLPVVAAYGGTVLHSTLAPDAEQRLQAMLDAGAAASAAGEGAGGTGQTNS